MVDALLDVAGEDGTIVVPTYSINRKFVEKTPWDLERNVAWKIKFSDYDPNSTPCWTGKIPDTLWRRPGAVRNSHVSHSIAAIGKDAFELSRDWKSLYNYNGYLLLLGVVFNRCSSMHLAEEFAQLPDDILEQITLTPELLDKYPKPWWEVYRKPYPFFENIDEPCKEAGIMKISKIGNAEVRLVRLRDLIDLYTKELNTNPYVYYPIKK